MVCPITFVPLSAQVCARAKQDGRVSEQGLLFESFNGSGMRQLKARPACTLAVIFMAQEPRLDVTEVEEFSA